MSANRSQLFYEEVTLGAAYTDANTFEFKTTMRNFKFLVSDGAGDFCEFCLTGAHEAEPLVDGKLLEGEFEDFLGMEGAKLSVRGQGTVRIWAWK